MGMQRVTLRIPKRQVERVDELADDDEYASRSEAIRSAVRDMLEKHERVVSEEKRPWAK